MQIRIQNRRRLYAGLIAIVFGCAGIYFGSSLRFGTAAAMGPGFLPIVCSWLIIALGIVVLTMSLFEDVEVIDPVAPRPVVMIFLAIGLFALLMERAGLGITVFVTAFTASYADRARLGETLILAAAAAAAAIVVFVFLLGLPIRIWPELG